MNRKNGIMLGALAGSLLASASALLGTRQTFMKRVKSQTKDWAEKAKHVKENLYDDMNSLLESKRARNQKMFLGGAVLGLLLGATSATLLTPKSGKQMRKDLSHGYQGVADKTQDIIGFINRNGYRKPIKKFAKALSKKKSPARARSRARA